MEKVLKSLSAEEKTVVGNIQSLLSELLSMSEGGEAPEAPMAPEAGTVEPVARAMPTAEETDEEKKKKEKEKIEKDQISTPSEGPTANDPAATVIDETQTEVSQDNVKEVAKAILQALSPKVAVKSIDPVLKALSDLTQVVGLSVKKSEDNAEAIEHILKGLGVADQVTAVRKSQGTPITEAGSNGDLVKALMSVLKSQKEVDGQPSTCGVRISNSQAVNKSLSDPNTLAALIGQKFVGR